MTPPKVTIQPGLPEYNAANNALILTEFSHTCIDDVIMSMILYSFYRIRRIVLHTLHNPKMYRFYHAPLC